MFKPKNCNRIVSRMFARLMMDEHPVNFVKTLKYLGRIINEQQHDTDEKTEKLKTCTSVQIF